MEDSYWEIKRSNNAIIDEAYKQFNGKTTLQGHIFVPHCWQWPGARGVIVFICAAGLKVCVNYPCLQIGSFFSFDKRVDRKEFDSFFFFFPLSMNLHANRHTAVFQPQDHGLC